MAIQFYIDESGKGGDGPIFVLTCLEAPAENWAALADEWRVVRDEEPAIDYFSMAECWAAQGQFKGMDRLNAWKKGEKLALIAKKHVSRVHSFFVNHEVFSKVFRGSVDLRYDDPYYFMAIDAIEEILTRHVSEGSKDTVEFIFDQQSAFEANVLEWFNAMSAGTIRDRPDIPVKAVAPNLPIFADEKVSTPLQAADMIAWNCRRLWSNALYKTEHKWFFPLAHAIEAIPTFHIRTEEDWLRAELRRLSDALPERSAYYYGAVKAREAIDVAQSAKNREILLQASNAKDFPLLETISTKRMKRFVLRNSCPMCGNPHLHNRSSDRCFGVETGSW